MSFGERERRGWKSKELERISRGLKGSCERKWWWGQKHKVPNTIGSCYGNTALHVLLRDKVHL